MIWSRFIAEMYHSTRKSDRSIPFIRGALMHSELRTKCLISGCHPILIVHENMIPICIKFLIILQVLRVLNRLELMCRYSAGSMCVLNFVRSNLLSHFIKMVGDMKKVSIFFNASTTTSATSSTTVCTVSVSACIMVIYQTKLFEIKNMLYMEKRISKLFSNKLSKILWWCFSLLNFTH